MKNLMKITIVVLVTMLLTDVYAQKVGVKAGLNLANMLTKDDEETYSDDYDMKPGFHIGATLEFPLSDMISFEPGLMLSTKGFKMSIEGSEMGISYENEIKVNLVYLDIPLNLKAGLDVGGAKVYGLVGPYVGIGMTGKMKGEVTVGGETVEDEDDIEWGSDEEKSDLKRLDFGLTVGAGVEVSSFEVGLSYGLGLANISPYTEDGYKVANRVFAISVGYKFEL